MYDKYGLTKWWDENARTSVKMPRPRSQKSLVFSLTCHVFRPGFHGLHPNSRHSRRNRRRTRVSQCHIPWFSLEISQLSVICSSFQHLFMVFRPHSQQNSYINKISAEHSPKWHMRGKAFIRDIFMAMYSIWLNAHWRCSVLIIIFTTFHINGNGIDLKMSKAQAKRTKQNPLNSNEFHGFYSIPSNPYTLMAVSILLPTEFHTAHRWTNRIVLHSHKSVVYLAENPAKRVPLAPSPSAHSVPKCSIHMQALRVFEILLPTIKIIQQQFFFLSPIFDIFQPSVSQTARIQSAQGKQIRPRP